MAETKPTRRMKDLRNHLFDAIEAVKEAKKETLGDEIARARAIAAVGQTILESAKVEISAHRADQQVKSELLEDGKALPEKVQKPHL